MTQLDEAKRQQLGAWMKEYQGLRKSLAANPKLQRFAALKDALKNVFSALGHEGKKGEAEPFVAPDGTCGMLSVSESIRLEIPKETRTALKEAHGAQVEESREPVTCDAQVVVKLGQTKRLKIYHPEASESEAEVDLAEEFLRSLKAGDRIDDPAEVAVDEAAAA